MSTQPTLATLSSMSAFTSTTCPLHASALRQKADERPMPAYYVFHNRIVDQAKMEEYVPKALETLAPYDPELLILDEDSETVEGSTNLPRTIVIGFESRERAEAWYQSPEYQAIRHLRLDATEGYAVLVDGFVAPDS